MTPGATVFHPEFGRGKVVRLYPEGPTAMVDFGYMTELVAVSALQGNHAAAAPVLPPRAGVRTPPPPTQATRKTGLPSETVAARRAIVALRLGQVLESHVGDLSVGLTEIAKRFDAALERARSHHPVYMLIEGAWGQGKTHLLTMLAAAAVRKEFALSSAVMDGVGVTLSDPMPLLETITTSIRFPGDALPGGLSINLARARRQGNLERLAQQGATLLAQVFNQIPLAAFDEFDVLQLLEDYLCLHLPTSSAQGGLATLGYRGLQLPPLRARSVVDRPQRFSELLFNWTQLCSLAGGRGLVVILDEMDVEYASTAGRSQQAARLRERRTELLGVLKRLHRQRLPLVLAFASAPAGPGVDPQHNASTNIAELLGELDEHVVAPTPGTRELEELLTKVIALYRQAYPDAASMKDPALLAQLTDRLIATHRRQVNPVPRYFVRSAIEAMDVMATGAGIQANGS